MFRILLLPITVLTLAAQAAAPPAFEVESVKPTAHGRDARGWSHSIEMLVIDHVAKTPTAN